MLSDGAEVQEEDLGTEWSWERLYDSMSTSMKRNIDRRTKVLRVEMAILRRAPWLRWPLIRLVTDFWVTLADEGIRATCKPRWGALTFGYLNDGMDPSLWHTMQEVFGGKKYSMLYPAGAPRSKMEADNYVTIHKDWFARKDEKTVD